MATTRCVLTPYAAEFPATNFPQLLLSNRRPVLAYDATTEEEAFWTVRGWQGLSGALTVIVTYAMASATSGGVAFSAGVEAITPGDATDTDATNSFDTENTGSDGTVPGTAGYIDEVSITLTNADSIAVGDYVRIRISREVNNGSDTATGDAYLLSAELREA